MPLKLKLLSTESGFINQVSGEDFSVEPTDSRRPFRALLDVGLVRTTTGNRVFGALKVYLVSPFNISCKIRYGSLYGLVDFT